MHAIAFLLNEPVVVVVVVVVRSCLSSMPSIVYFVFASSSPIHSLRAINRVKRQPRSPLTTTTILEKRFFLGNDVCPSLVRSCIVVIVVVVVVSLNNLPRAMRSGTFYVFGRGYLGTLYRRNKRVLEA